MNFGAVCTVIAVLCVGFSAGDVGYQVTDVDTYKLIGTHGKSSLYQVELQNNAYDWPVYLLDLHGSRMNMGYDYGYLLAKQMDVAYDNLMASIVGNSWYDAVIQFIIEAALDWQWDSFLSQQVPDAYLEEIAGIGIGAHDGAGVGDANKCVSRIITLANAPGDPLDFLLVLIQEWNSSIGADVLNKIKRKDAEPVAGLQCSMFGVWGSRTADGSLFTGRNLDWNKDTGIQQAKLITVFHPDDGAFAHATLGYIGFLGALTGMSSQGLTVHEANLEENEITFEGFPWVLRLRYIMENANNLEKARLLWQITNNTVGFNHMIGSASDKKSMVMETMRDYTAYFFDNDPREQQAVYVNPSNNQTQQLGYPLTEAVYRTNHGFDPKIRKHYEWSQSPNSWSMQRYMYFYEGFSWYQAVHQPIDELAAVNMTAIVGDKGHHAYQCEDNTDGSNVLSATYHPGANILYVAWEDGTGASWRPACCNTYIKIDMTHWWKITKD